MNNIKKNLFYNIAYQILILIVPLITTPYVSRVLLPDGVGQYSITTSFANYFWLFAMLGMASYGNRNIAKCKSKNELEKTFSSLFLFQLCNAIIWVLLFFIFALTIGYKKYNILLICQLPYVISSIFEISWYYYGTEQFKFMVKRNSIIKVFTAILVFTFVKTKNDVWIYILINSFSLLIGQLCLWPFLLKKIKFVKVPKVEILNHLKPNLILFISVVAVSIYTLMDKIMLELMTNSAELGFYENSYKMMNICCSIVGAIGTVMLPRITSLMVNNEKDKIIEYIDKSMKYIMAFSCMISFGFAAIANDFSIIFFGKQFARCGVVMIAIAPTILFYSWENIVKNQYLLPYNKDKIFVKATVYAALVNVFLNLFFIRIFGAVGAAIATSISLLVASGYQTLGVIKELNFKKYFKNVLIYSAFGIIMIGFCRILSSLLNNDIFGLIIETLLGGLLYIVLIILYFLAIKNKEIVQVLLKNK